jgi:hypothetical protein
MSTRTDSSQAAEPGTEATAVHAPELIAHKPHRSLSACHERRGEKERISESGYRIH